MGGTYTSDPLKVFATYETLHAPDVASRSDKSKHFWMGARYQASSVLTLIGGVFQAKENKNGGKGTLFVLGAHYALSKRTLAYATMGSVSNNARGNFAVDATNQRNPRAGGGQMGTYIGIAHSF